MGGLVATATKLAAASNSARAHERLPADIRELTGYAPRPLQAQLHSQLNRFNVFVCHRRFGKTVLCVNELIESAVNCLMPAGRYAYIAPTYEQAEDIAWAYLLQFTSKVPDRKVETSKLAVTIPTYNGGRARIRLYGADSKKERLRGLYLDGVVLDESQDLLPSVFTAQVRPMLSDKDRAGLDARFRPNQWAVFIGTPKGRNIFYTRYKQASLWARGLPVLEGVAGEQKKIFRDDWHAALFKASETGLVTAPELEAARIDMGISKYEQEYECSFDAAIEGAIYARVLEELREGGRITTFPLVKEVPVITGWDLGLDDHTAIWFAQIVAGEPRIIDYYEARQQPLEHYVEVLAAKDYRYGKFYFPHDVEQKTLASGGKSCAQLLRAMGVRVTTVPKHTIRDGQAATEAFLAKCWFEESGTAEGMDRLAMYRREYDERMSKFSDKARHDDASHGADAMRTLAMGVRLSSPADGGRQTVGEM